MLQFFHKSILLFPKPRMADTDLDDITNYKNGDIPNDVVSTVHHKNAVLHRTRIPDFLLDHKSNNICVEWIFQYFDNKDIANLLLYFFPRQFLTILWRISNVIS